MLGIQGVYMHRSLLLSTVAVAGLISALTLPAATAQAESAPAVSQLNFKFDGGGGVIDHRSIGYAQASVAVPLTHSTGLQVDGTVGDWQGKAFQGLNTHLFWRDPSIGLVGVFGEYLTTNAPHARFYDPFGGVTTEDGSTLQRAAAEGEYYFGRFSFEGRVGWEGGTVGERAYDRAILAYYPTSDFRMSLGQFTEAGQSFGDVSLEYQPSEKLGAVLFADAFGTHGTLSATAGVRFYFGAGSKSLIDHARQDDPTVDVPQDLIGIGHALKIHHSAEVCHFEGRVIPCET